MSVANIRSVVGEVWINIRYSDDKLAIGHEVRRVMLT